MEQTEHTIISFTPISHRNFVCFLLNIGEAGGQDQFRHIIKNPDVDTSVIRGFAEDIAKAGYVRIWWQCLIIALENDVVLNVLEPATRVEIRVCVPVDTVETTDVERSQKKTHVD